MSDGYVARVTLEINGQVVEDFISVSENAREARKEVKLMNKTGYANVTPRYGGEVEYSVPATGTEFDFDGLENGTLTIIHDGGRRVEFSGVTVLEIGDAKSDGEKEMTRTIKWIADKRSVS